MKLKNVLLVVDNIERSKAFYKELFGLVVVKDFESNVILSEGLVLQDRNVWQEYMNRPIASGGNVMELYFEENDMDSFRKRLESYPEPIIFVSPFEELDGGQQVVRFYDPDQHLIEVRETMEHVIKRFLQSGISAEETAKKTNLPITMVKESFEDEICKEQEEKGR